MKKISTFCLLAFVALCGLTACKEDPVEFNNIPTLALSQPTNLLRTSVTLHGIIVTDYPQHIDEYGFLFSSSIDFSSSDTQCLPMNAESLADISVNITDLEIGETYFYLLYAKAADEIRSDVRSITMPMRSGAALSEVEILDLYAPTLRASIVDDGGSAINSVGFCWGTSPNPTIFTGEHEFATYDEESQSFTASLTKLKGHENYYVRAFAECDVTGSGDISISYGEATSLSLKHKATLTAVEATTTTLTFSLTPFNCEQVKWLLSTETGVAAEKVFAEGTAANATDASEIKVENLNPETTYYIYAVAEAEEELVSATPIEMTTGPAPTVKVEAVAQDYTSLTFAITSTNAERVKYLFYSEDELATAGEITAEKVLEEGTSVEANKRVSVTREGLSTEKTFHIFAAASIETATTELKSLELFTATTPQSWRIYYTSTNGNIVEPYSVYGFGANIVSNTYENGQGVIIFDGEVSQFGQQVFLDCKTLKSILIPSGVQKIAVESFRGCTNLTSATLSEGITTIEDGAFKYCESLTEIAIPDSVTEIEEQVFLGCGNMTAFYGKYASSDSRCLIKDGTLLYFAPQGLTSYSIPRDVVAIGNSVFEGNGNLVEIVIPESVTAIGNSAFVCCTALKNITIPDSVTTIGSSAFYYCLELKEVTLSKNITALKSNIFAMCVSLQELVIPDGVASIGDGAFSDCTSLNTITIPYSVVSVGECAFSCCHALAAFYGKFASQDNRCLIIDGKLNSFAPAGLSEYSIPDNVISIGKNTFKDYTSLTAITIPNSVTSIGEGAFSGCTSLTSIYCKPTTPPSLGENAFSNISSTAKIQVPYISYKEYKNQWSMYANLLTYSDSEIPDNCKIYYTSSDGKIVTPSRTGGFGAGIVSNTYENGEGVIIFDGVVTTIGYYAFEDCVNLTNIVIPDKVTTIEARAFSRCTGLTSVTIPDSVTTLGSPIFDGCSNLSAFYGKFASSDNRCLIADQYLYSFAPAGLTTYAIPENVQYIESWAFSECNELESVTIPDTVYDIGYGAFANCESLAAFYGRYSSSDNRCLIIRGILTAFAGAGVTEYVTPSDVISIGGGAFYGCNIGKLTITDNVTSIEDGAFMGCQPLSDVTIGNGVISIGSEAFMFCDIVSLTIGNKVRTIGDFAFSTCMLLTSVTIPESVTDIGDEAFDGCVKLTRVYSKPATPPLAGWGIFYDTPSNLKIYVPSGKVNTYKSAEGWSDYADAIVGYDF